MLYTFIITIAGLLIAGGPPYLLLKRRGGTGRAIGGYFLGLMAGWLLWFALDVATQNHHSSATGLVLWCGLLAPLAGIYYANKKRGAPPHPATTAVP